MQETVTKAIVLDKIKETTGFLFKNVEYFWILKIPKTNQTFKRKATLDQFYSNQIGDEINIILYRCSSSQNWYFTKEEAGYYD